MSQFLRHFTKRTFILINISVGLVYLLACSNAWISPGVLWWPSILSLIFPFLLALVVFFLFFWLLFRSKWAILSLSLLIIGFSNIRALIGLHSSHKTNVNTPKSKDVFRVLTWNVALFDIEMLRENSNKKFRNNMVNFIAAQDADVMCMQEHLEGHGDREKYYSNLDDFKKMGFKYHYIVNDRKISVFKYPSGLAIYSKYPIIDSARIRFKEGFLNSTPESLIYVDLKVGKDTVRIFTTHLQSNLFDKKDWKNIVKIKNGDDSMLLTSYTIMQKLKAAGKVRADQADLMKSSIEKSPFPSIVCGDFNDVPNSYIYFAIKGDKKDAFTEKGSGLGRTFKFLSPTLRIDYIFVDPLFRVSNYFRPNQDFSDHDPVIADLKW